MATRRKVTSDTPKTPKKPRTSKKQVAVKVTLDSCIPKGWSLRDNQRIILEQLIENYDKADVFVIDASVGSGKSLVGVIAATYAWRAYGHKSSLIVPNNILLKQYESTFPNIVATVGRQSSYSCIKYEDQRQKQNCKKEKQLCGTFCKGCPYLGDLRKAQVRPISLYNYHSYMAYKAYRPLVIVDEAHNTIQMISESAATKIWQHDYDYPNWVKDYRTMYQWASDVVNAHRRRMVSDPSALPPPPKLVKLLEELDANRTSKVFTRTTALWRNEERDVILASPVDISNEPPLLWPSRVEKLVMMSATFNSRDIRELGLSHRRVCYIKSPSPIPKERRPAVVRPVANMSYSKQLTSVPVMVDYVKRFLDSNPDKGFIHAPYALANKLREHLQDHPRILFHSAADKMKVFKQYCETPGTVLVASGMYEGVSLDEDLARWQLILKVPWPSLTEPAMEYLAKEDGEYYANRTIKDIVQTYGRVCRGAEDYGATYILDATFVRLFKQYRHLFPSWFTEATTIEEPIP